ncbi:hypothetical protein CALCODRAFT_511317 [Calocera cornea HHB12733]|uniref:Uncharacterized protein n=1 Tax=Calocera cornea HHB12733 TaxID=1353952 RepID=A0A165DV67_9BASI|nr:hypothetical protein CALCODRAFT_511317 [Calocera cornea HHB12733]
MATLLPDAVSAIVDMSAVNVDWTAVLSSPHISRLVRLTIYDFVEEDASLWRLLTDNIKKFMGDSWCSTAWIEYNQWAYTEEDDTDPVDPCYLFGRGESDPIVADPVYSAANDIVHNHDAGICGSTNIPMDNNDISIKSSAANDRVQSPDPIHPQSTSLPTSSAPQPNAAYEARRYEMVPSRDVTFDAMAAYHEICYRSAWGFVRSRTSVDDPLPDIPENIASTVIIDCGSPEFGRAHVFVAVDPDMEVTLCDNIVAHNCLPSKSEIEFVDPLDEDGSVIGGMHSEWCMECDTDYGIDKLDDVPRGLRTTCGGPVLEPGQSFPWSCRNCTERGLRCSYSIVANLEYAAVLVTLESKKEDASLLSYRSTLPVVAYHPNGTSSRIVGYPWMKHVSVGLGNARLDAISSPLWIRRSSSSPVTPSANTAHAQSTAHRSTVDPSADMSSHVVTDPILSGDVSATPNHDPFPALRAEASRFPNSGLSQWRGPSLPSAESMSDFSYGHSSNPYMIDLFR